METGITSYTEAFSEIRKLGNVSEVYEKMFDEVDKSYLENVQHVISIGPGPGFNDLAFLKKLTPNLKHFTAIETDESCLGELSKNVEKFLPRDVNIKIYQKGAQYWAGPSPEEAKADLVLMFHATYYFNKKERIDIYKKCFNNWLKADGKLFIMNNKDIHGTTTTNFMNDIYRETGRKPQVESFIIKQELNKLGYIIDKVYDYEHYHDLKLLNDLVVAFIVKVADPPYENDKMVRKALKKLVDENKQGYTYGDLFSVIRKT
ncbi:hypothetical protein HELRODRAFT_178497 [Helobdella robusta]|uniref:Methyltransferase domain-containing protein n=1 Tax=Helobdella robusta TaxID=6412 RepID=T1FD96_HELRO|nr:hypothetical protein HELRODRAFT_178497 [Helobdella robusta]ESN97051.1 hypothetical protein HELRODRAFT_178497 [Helobdella robusta]